jgi:hypothetical protein
MSTLREAAQQALEALESLFTLQMNYILLEQREDAITALRAALAQQEQEPKAWMLTDDSGMRFVSVDRPHPDFVPLYTHPPRREWRSLTDEEIDTALPHEPGDLDFVCARAVEAALKEKNHE